jgi:hypothetical protein
VTATLMGGIMFVFAFGGALGGMVLRKALPEHHLTMESRDVIKLGVGLIATMSALILGLLVASAKGSYDTQRNEVIQLSGEVVVLDRVLAHYGGEAKEARDVLKTVVGNMIDRLWSRKESPRTEESMTGEILLDKIQELSPTSDAQRSLQSQAVNMVIKLGQTRWLLVAQSRRSIPVPFLVAVVFWFCIIFASFGLSAPRNPVVIITLLICALSVSLAIFMILELDQPFQGMVQISSEPLRNALAHLGK